MKHTAVEWLYERLERMIPRTALYNMDKEDYFKKAKEMEKQQIVKAASSAYEDMFGTDGTEYGQKYYEKLTQDDK